MQYLMLSTFKCEKQYYVTHCKFSDTDIYNELPFSLKLNIRNFRF